MALSLQNDRHHGSRHRAAWEKSLWHAGLHWRLWRSLWWSHRTWFSLPLFLWHVWCQHSRDFSSQEDLQRGTCRDLVRSWKRWSNSTKVRRDELEKVETRLWWGHAKDEQRFGDWPLPNQVQNALVAAQRWAEQGAGVQAQIWQETSRQQDQAWER